MVEEMDVEWMKCIVTILDKTMRLLGVCSDAYSGASYAIPCVNGFVIGENGKDLAFPLLALNTNWISDLYMMFT